jgi:RES domain-containing protein
LAIEQYVRPWSGIAYRHVTAHRSYDPLDFRLAGLGKLNRWNVPGEPTLYLAGDEGVLITEWGRHFNTNRPTELAEIAEEREVLRFGISVESLLDLRDTAVLEELSLEDAPNCFLDRDRARVTARFIRTVTPAQGILVPPITFLDQPDRWSLVLFLEKLPEPKDFITSVSTFGPLKRG